MEDELIQTDTNRDHETNIPNPPAIGDINTYHGQTSVDPLGLCRAAP